MKFSNRTLLDGARLRELFERHSAPYRHDALSVRVRYSRSADFSGVCFYRDSRIHINLGRHNRYPYRLATHVARARSNSRYWWRSVSARTERRVSTRALYLSARTLSLSCEIGRSLSATQRIDVRSLRRARAGRSVRRAASPERRSQRLTRRMGFSGFGALRRSRSARSRGGVVRGLIKSREKLFGVLCVRQRRNGRVICGKVDALGSRRGHGFRIADSSARA